MKPSNDPLLASAHADETDAVRRDLEAPGVKTGFLRQISASSASSSMEWTRVSFDIKDKNILADVSGSVRPGEMTCILGPSGAGKSTLLNILAGRMNTRAQGMKFTGEVSIAGSVMDPVDARSHVAYVMQDDALPGLSTPREILAMSAVLRGTGGSSGEVAGQVNELLEALRLTKCADTYAGTALIKGLSGGEKKRTAVAVELISKPKMIFLDEPLSGLDSYAAWTVVQVLRELAANGCAVLCTIHQPSSEIFQSFDTVMCLAEGRVCYASRVARLTQYLERVRHPVPTHYNPADHILFLVQTLPKEELASLTQSWAEEERGSVLPQIAAARSGASALTAARAVRQKSFGVQLGFLVRREAQQLLRNKVGLIMRFVVNGVMGLFFAFIFLGIGGKDTDAGGMQGHFGAICNLMIGTMFGSSQPLLLQFPSERPVFLREYASNLYGVVPYFLAKAIVELPVSLLTALESWLIGYWVMNFQGNFFYLVIISWALSLTASSTALFIGCSVTNAQSAQELAPLLFVPQIIFSGVFIPTNLVPVGLRWLQYICALKYAINLGCIVEYDGIPGGQILFKQMSIEPDKAWLYTAILVGIFVVFRTLAMSALRKRARFVY